MGGPKRPNGEKQRSGKSRLCENTTAGAVTPFASPIASLAESRPIFTSSMTSIGITGIAGIVSHKWALSPQTAEHVQNTPLLAFPTPATLSSKQRLRTDPYLGRAWPRPIVLDQTVTDCEYEVAKDRGSSPNITIVSGTRYYTVGNVVSNKCGTLFKGLDHQGQGQLQRSATLRSWLAHSSCSCVQTTKRPSH